MTMVGDTKSKEVDLSNTTTEDTEKKNVFDDLESTTPIPVSEETKESEKNAALPGVVSGTAENKGVINHEKYDEQELVITNTEKSTFIDAMITGERYRQSYSIFGGKVNIIIRSRTNKETQAMYAYIRHELSQDGGNLTLLEGDMQYMLLLAQVEEVNGTKYPEMKTPLTYVESGGSTQEPGWVADLNAWKNRPEGLVSAIINRIQLFEYKYWTMVKEASNKNFWNSDTSIAE